MQHSTQTLYTVQEHAYDTRHYPQVLTDAGWMFYLKISTNYFM